ncbi:hypothetical protein [Mesorhizobium sp. M0208]
MLDFEALPEFFDAVTDPARMFFPDRHKPLPDQDFDIEAFDALAKF